MRLPATLRRWGFRVGRILGIVAAVCFVAIFSLQGHLVWHPDPYGIEVLIKSFPRPLTLLRFHTNQGNQTAYYAPPRDGRSLPVSLWLMFGGNGSLAMDWYEVAGADKDPGRAFLFIDYPGYGRCQGSPSPATIRDNIAGALGLLAKQLGQPDASALERAVAAHGQFAVAGFSMGTGVSLDFAASHPEVSRVVLAAPYTSLRDMARRLVGWPLNYLLRGNYDNRARLADLAARPNPPSVFIFHGDHDTLIPQTMGRSLAAAHPSFAHFETVPGAGHEDILEVARVALVRAIDER